MSLKLFKPLWGLDEIKLLNKALTFRGHVSGNKNPAYD